MAANKWGKRGRPKGLPKSGGRKKGTPNKATRWKLHLEGKEYKPLDFLLGVMWNGQAPMELRFKAAIAAAPYCHPQLRSVDFKGSMTVGVSAALLKFIEGNTSASRSFLDFDREDRDEEEAPHGRPLLDH
jgi:hypothetical protein